MCLPRNRPAPPPPLPPAPPPPLPPTPPTPPPDPVVKDVNPNVRRAKKERGNKTKGEFSSGTGSMRIKKNTGVNTSSDSAGSGGINSGGA
tara:strand:- start:94 stop:363 length:270 start_codon:yes stop_codon:yes gene_type:complete